MFLSKKGLIKICIVGACYLLLSCSCFLAAVIFWLFAAESLPLFILSLFAFALGVCAVLVGFYAEGKGKFINKGTKLLFVDLNPAEFIINTKA